MKALSQEEILELELSAAGKLARETLLNDMHLLQTHSASPILNLIKCYERDYAYPFFSTDVYSFHSIAHLLPPILFYALTMVSRVNYLQIHNPNKKS